MAGRKLNFAALVPQRDEFEDLDGTKYEFRSKADFGAMDHARGSRFSDELRSALEALGTNPQDEAAASRFEHTTEEFVRLILPTLPNERLKALTLGQKAAIVQWWQESPQGEAQAGETPKP